DPGSPTNVNFLPGALPPTNPTDTIAAAVGTAATAITITSTNPLPASFVTGVSVTITGVAGFAAANTTAANPTFVVTVTGTNTFTLNGTIGTVGAGTPNTGSWTEQNNPPGIGTMLLLTDGTIMVTGGFNQNSQDWYRLTPDTGGDYAKGTWSQLAPMGT